MLELQEAFQHLKARREDAIARLSEPAMLLLGSLRKPWPTEVLVMLADVPLCPLIHKINEKAVKVEFSLITLVDIVHG